MGFLLGNGIYSLQGVFEQAGIGSDRSLQITLFLFGLVSLVLVYLPVIFVDEKNTACPGVRSRGSGKL